MTHQQDAQPVLPPLPEPNIRGVPAFAPISFGAYVRPVQDVFTADQMHAYARAALATHQAPTLHETDIYDFAGWLTTRPGVMSVGSSSEAGPMAEAVGEYIKTFPERFQAAQQAAEPWGYAVKAYGWSLVEKHTYEAVLKDTGRHDYVAKLYTHAPATPQAEPLKPNFIESHDPFAELLATTPPPVQPPEAESQHHDTLPELPHEPISTSAPVLVEVPCVRPSVQGRLDNSLCKGLNCGTTTNQHSAECEAGHAAAIAGGTFVPQAVQPPKPEPDSGYASPEYRRVLAMMGKALKRLTVAARTSGGPDAELMSACGQAEEALSLHGISSAIDGDPAVQAVQPQGERGQIIRDAVDRFLCWPIPTDFTPDFYISFDSQMCERKTHGKWPTGTNLFTAVQAKAMFEHCLADALASPAVVRDREADRKRYPDLDFQSWLDETITENGEFTAWHALSSVGDAYAGWQVGTKAEAGWHTDEVVKLKCQIDKLQTALASRAVQPMTLEQRAVLAFLHGDGAINGYGFGDERPGHGRFWWRKYLRSAFPGITQPQPKQDGGAK